MEATKEVLFKRRVVLVLAGFLVCSALASNLASSDTTSDDAVKPSKFFLCAAYNVIVGIFGPISVFLLVLAGILWLRSEDDPQQRQVAKEMITNVVVGIVILLVAAGVVYIITSATGSPFTWSSFCP